MPVLWSLKGSTASCPSQEARLAMPAEAQQINTSKQSPQATRVQIRQQQYQDTYVQFPSWGLRNVDFLVSNNLTKNSVPFLKPCFSCATPVDKPEKD